LADLAFEVVLESSWLLGLGREDESAGSQLSELGNEDVLFLWRSWCKISDL
jgi:hypothetical protein